MNIRTISIFTSQEIYINDLDAFVIKPKNEYTVRSINVLF